MSIEKALGKLRAAQMCCPNAVQALIDEAIAAIHQVEAQQPAQATQAEVTDEEIEALFGKCGGHWSGDQGVIEEADLHLFARAILALRPAAVPMTHDQRRLAFLASRAGHGFPAFMLGIQFAEAHHGITAQAKKETT